jgi:hypothetical protein
MSYLSSYGMGAAVPTDSNYDAATGSVMAMDLASGQNRRVPLAQATPVTFSLINGTQNYPWSVAQCGGNNVYSINYVTGTAPAGNSQSGGQPGSGTSPLSSAPLSSSSLQASGGASSSSGDFVSSAWAWIQNNPMLAAAAGIGIVLLVVRR